MMEGIEELKPRMKRRGMFHMKTVTVELAPKYENFAGGHLPQLGFLGYLYEVCNLSNGQRTLGAIRRALGHELGVWPKIEALGSMVRDMERLDYMSVDE